MPVNFVGLAYVMVSHPQFERIIYICRKTQPRPARMTNTTNEREKELERL